MWKTSAENIFYGDLSYLLKRLKRYRLSHILSKIILHKPGSIIFFFTIFFNPRLTRRSTTIRSRFTNSRAQYNLKC